MTVAPEAAQEQRVPPTGSAVLLQLMALMLSISGFGY